jgi:hypothetical protein
VNGKSRDARACAAARHSTDGSGRAGDERHERSVKFTGILGLMVDARLAAVVVKTRRRNLAARVAIDATRVHEEFTFHVLGEPLANLRHWILDSGGPRKSQFPGIASDFRALQPKYLIIPPSRRAQKFRSGSPVR